MPTDALGSIIRFMSDRGFHEIEADLDDSWLEDWAGVGISELEAYLAKHAAFLAFLDGENRSSHAV